MPSLPDKEKSKSIARRAGWLMLTILFIVTGLGVGLVAFWQATHPAKPDTSQATPPPPTTNANKLEGTQMHDFTLPAKYSRARWIPANPYRFH
jgi:uncharacterized protein HemX